MNNNNDAAIALLEKHFDIAFASSDGIKKLRELILSLAMQGKLVSQDPSDQPASELLKEIEIEKERLIKEGKIKKSKPLPEIKPDEIPYDLPKSWEWLRLGESVNFMTGKLDSNAAVENGIYPFFTCAKESLFIDYYAFDCEAVLLAGNNAAGKYNVKHYKGKFNAYQRTYIITVEFGQKKAIDYGYLKYLLENMLDDLQAKSLGTLTQFLTLGILKPILIPLPPLAEQRRIVTKIDELMVRCDELEKLRGDRDRKQITVHTAALNRLLIAKQQSEFNTAWQFITQHFSELYSVKENVTELRKAILQLAVMGKLVSQDPNDQPASELLKEIEAEKTRLVKEGKIKQSKPLPEIKPNEVPYELPKSWKWSRLGEIVSLLGDGIHGTPIYDETGDYFFINGNNLSDGIIEIKENTKKISINEYLKYKKELNSRTVLVSINGTIGNVAFYNNENVILGKSACYFNLFEQIDKQFTKRLLNSQYFLEYAFASATGSTIKNVSLKSMRHFKFPLPPLAEQHRIVAKIDQLMTLCDNLEKQIDNANSKQTNLLNAVMTKV